MRGSADFGAMTHNGQERPSLAVAWVTHSSECVLPPEDDGSNWEDHPAYAKLYGVIESAQRQMPAAGGFGTSVLGPSQDELSQVQVWITDHPDELSDLSDGFDMPPDAAQAAAWVADWTLRLTEGDRGHMYKQVGPTAAVPDLLVDVADWIQTICADLGQSMPGPACPGHEHPARPVVHERQAWWACPETGHLRPWL